MAINALRRAVDNAVLSRFSSAAVKPSASMDASDNKKTRHKLKKFLTRRPTLQAVRDKGYIKGATTRSWFSQIAAKILRLRFGILLYYLFSFFI